MIELLEQPNKCEYCNRKFVNERTLFTHMCEQKRRALQKNEKRVQAGFLAFNRFYSLTQNSNKTKTYEEFCASPFYNAFVKFGSHITNLKALYPEKFIDYLIKRGTKLDNWCQDKIYEEFLVDILKNESAEQAIQRSLETMIKWGEENNADFTHYFKYVNLNRAVNDILNGNISCWLVLNCNSGKSMIQRMNDEQISLISQLIDLKFWLKRFKELPVDNNFVLDICKELKIK
jgi:hypothetical protein